MPTRQWIVTSFTALTLGAYSSWALIRDPALIIAQTKLHSYEREHNYIMAGKVLSGSSLPNLLSVKNSKSSDPGEYCRHNSLI